MVLSKKYDFLYVGFKQIYVYNTTDWTLKADPLKFNSKSAFGKNLKLDVSFDDNFLAVFD